MTLILYTEAMVAKADGAHREHQFVRHADDGEGVTAVPSESETKHDALVLSAGSRAVLLLTDCPTCSRTITNQTTVAACVLFSILLGFLPTSLDLGTFTGAFLLARRTAHQYAPTAASISCCSSCLPVSQPVFFSQR